MKMDPISSYPGSDASPKQIIALAEQYRAAAEILHRDGPRGHARRWAPFRLCACQAIELCLSAALRHAGMEAALVRGMHHKLKERLDLLDPAAPLSDKARERLILLEERREYLVVRYDAARLNQTLHPDALLATVQEVEAVVRQLVADELKPPRA
ncbi:MAG TPA: hypothetical protein VGE65_09095 [Sphingobium sp.]